MLAPLIKGLMRTLASANVVHLSRSVLQLRYSTPLPANATVQISPHSAQEGRYLIPKPAGVDVHIHFHVQGTSGLIPTLANASVMYVGHNVRQYRPSMKCCVSVNVLAGLHALRDRYLMSSSVDAVAVAALHALETSSSILIPASVNALEEKHAPSPRGSIPSLVSVDVLTDHHSAATPTKSLIQVLVHVDAHLSLVADLKDRIQTHVSVNVLMQAERAPTYPKSLTPKLVVADVPMSLSVQETRDLITAYAHVAASMHTPSALKDRSSTM